MSDKGEIMKFYAKTFSELSAREIYEILKSRMEIFLLEQNIKYLDPDDVDYNSLHVFFEHESRVVAYFRAFEHGDRNVKIGRVLTLEHGKGLGKRLMLGRIPCDHGKKHLKERTAFCRSFCVKEDFFP